MEDDEGNDGEPEQEDDSVAVASDDVPVVEKEAPLPPMKKAVVPYVDRPGFVRAKLMVKGRLVEAYVSEKADKNNMHFALDRRGKLCSKLSEEKFVKLKAEALKRK